MNKQWMASIAGVLILALVALGAPLAAQDAPDEDPTVAKFNQEWEALTPEMRAALNRMIEMSGAKDQVGNMFQMINGQFGKIIEKAEQDMGRSDPRFRELTNRHMERMGELMVTHFDEWMRPMMVAYARHYTLEEIQELIAFYESPVGRKLLETMPKLMADAMEGMMPIMMKHMEKANRELKEEMDALMEEIAAESGNASPAESRYTDLEAQAVGAVRLIAVCAVGYQIDHPGNGYPDDLGQLGASGYNCIDERLASGVFKGYQFEYQPTDPVGKINTDFTVVAFPVEYDAETKKSFFSDSSGVIHFTTEDRYAKASDPLL